MAEETKDLSLEDLGIEKEETPAEKAAKQNTQVQEKTVDQNTGVISVTPNENVEEHFVSAKKEQHKVPRPDGNKRNRNEEDELSHFKTVEINDIAKIPLKPKEDFVETSRKKEMSSLYELADKGIERTKKELTKPGGRIDVAKHEYVKTKYNQLMQRAKRNKHLQQKIDAMNKAMDTDPRFDDISDYERHGYILFSVARDNKVETNDDYFGVKKEKAPRFRNSHDAAAEIDKISDDDEQHSDIDIYDDSKTVVMTDNDTPDIPEKDTSKEDEDLIPEKDDDDEEESTEEDQINTSEDDEELESDDYDDEDDDFELSDDQQKKILNRYKDEIVDSLGLSKIQDISDFSIAEKPIKLNNALSGHIKKTITWGLQFSGVAVDMTPLSGEELIQLNPQQTKYDTVEGLTTVFNIIWHHIANPNKPKFETWLKQISDYDVDCLLFAIYVANFKDTNILTYECPNKKCKNVFIKKFDVEDMIVYPNDKVKKHFQKVLRKETSGTSLYKTKPIAVSNDYAIRFVTQSVYSNLFEPASLSDAFAKRLE